MSKKKKSIQLLERAVGQFDRIFVFENEELIPEVFSENKTIAHKLLILSEKQMVPDTDNIIFQQITEEEKEQIINLYFTYEFSDKFTFVSRNNINYGGLFHFIDTGILSKEEAFEALIR